MHTVLVCFVIFVAWWRHQMETFSALLAICAGNSPVPGEFPPQRPVTRSFYVFFDVRLNKRLSKQAWGWWFETLSCPLWRRCNGSCGFMCVCNQIFRIALLATAQSIGCGNTYEAAWKIWINFISVKLQQSTVKNESCAHTCILGCTVYACIQWNTQNTSVF